MALALSKSSVTFALPQEHSGRPVGGLGGQISGPDVYERWGAVDLDHLGWKEYIEDLVDPVPAMSQESPEPEEAVGTCPSQGRRWLRWSNSLTAGPPGIHLSP